MSTIQREIQIQECLNGKTREESNDRNDQEMYSS